MSAFEWFVGLSVCVVAWLLVCRAHADDAQYYDDRYSICGECMGDCRYGETLCDACRRVARAKELKGESK